VIAKITNIKIKKPLNEPRRAGSKPAPAEGYASMAQLLDYFLHRVAFPLPASAHNDVYNTFASSGKGTAMIHNTNNANF
jgi:hypothetical protein